MASSRMASAAPLVSCTLPTVTVLRGSSATTSLRAGRRFIARMGIGLRGTGVITCVRGLAFGTWEFGVVEDFPNKETNSKSSFVPRVGLQDFQAVLEKQRDALNDARLREHGEEWCSHEPVEEDPYAGEEDGIEDDADEYDHHASQDAVHWH
eukprot:TRINITY_DN34834_c0_g1_i3.p1 TRINITY_DN34834_c0_g1~~TRINITY_DN34834_c0_g1_i3.p1  ORF type:complete len:152 (+),score=8.92 TRINITY_DN34834_c0_g1_i3:222-677(+)